MKSYEENVESPKFTNGQAVEVQAEGDGTLSGQVAEKALREEARITNIRLGNIQALLEAILDQNRKGVNSKSVLSIDLTAVPILDSI